MTEERKNEIIKKLNQVIRNTYGVCREEESIRELIVIIKEIVKEL